MKTSRAFSLIGTALLPALIFPANATLYKWVDSQGETHYTETLPPEYSNKGSQVLDKGRVVNRDDSFDRSKLKTTQPTTPEDKAAIEAKRHDNALLSSYTNENEIDLARDRNLLQYDARLDSYKTLLKSAQSTLSSLHEESNSRIKKGWKIPQSLTDDLETAENRVADLKKNIEQNQKDKEATRARFEADKIHYRELKGSQSDNAK